MLNKDIVLWLVRKAVYTAVGAAVAVVTAYFTQHAGGPDFNFTNLSIVGAIGGVVSAVVGDLRRALAPDFLQIATGADPRKDG
jgi:multisubunit Na+/H+ antiporter MnhB subunit